MAEPYTTARRRFVVAQVARAREVAHEAAGEGVAGAGRIEHVLERIGRREEDRALLEQERAVLALLDDHHRRAALHDPARGLHEVACIRELARFAVVQRDEVDVLDAARADRGAGSRSRSSSCRTRRASGARPGCSTSSCRRGSMLARKTKGALRNCVGNLRAEVREHAEVRLERLGRVEIVPIAAAPAERVARRLLQPRHVHAARPQRLELLHRVVVADDADELHGRQMARRGGEEGAGAAE